MAFSKLSDMANVCAESDARSVSKGTACECIAAYCVQCYSPHTGRHDACDCPLCLRIRRFQSASPLEEDVWTHEATRHPCVALAFIRRKHICCPLLGCPRPNESRRHSQRPAAMLNRYAFQDKRGRVRVNGIRESAKKDEEVRGNDWRGSLGERVAPSSRVRLLSQAFLRRGALAPLRSESTHAADGDDRKGDGAQAPPAGVARSRRLDVEMRKDGVDTVARIASAVVNVEARQ